MKRLYLLLLASSFACRSSICAAQQLPINPLRTVAFTTNEGSYINVDVSPDGQTLVFDLLGDLYSVSARGGKAVELTRGIALNLRPAWSPDGKKVTYLSDISGVFQPAVLNLTTHHQKILKVSNDEVSYGLDLLWMPNSQAIAVGNVVYALSGRRVLPGLDVRNALRLSKDGNLIYSLDSGRIYCYNITTKKANTISPLLKSFRYGILSPDAHWWCYVTDSNDQECLVLQDLKNDVAKILVSSLIKGSPHYRPAVPSRHFAFSPNCREIFIAYGGKIHRIDVVSGANRLIPFVANVKSDLGPIEHKTFRIPHDTVKVRYTRSANTSPDHKHLVFYALGKAYVMDLPTRKIRIAAQQTFRQFQPVYSMDGRWIAYVSWSDSLGGFLWRVPADGGKPEQLTHTAGQYQRPCWSPDGKYIAVIRGYPKLGERDDPGVGKLVLVAVNGGPEHTLADSIPLWNQLAFSSDGLRIFYTPHHILWSQKGSKIQQLVSTTLDGSDQRVAAVGAEFTVFQEKALSPDGRFLALSAGEDLYLVPVHDTMSPVVISYENRKIPGIKIGPGVDPYWELGGKFLAWSYGNRFYRVCPDEIVVAAQRKAGKSDSSSASATDFVTSNIKPRQVVNINLSAPYFHAYGTIALKNVRIITMQGKKVIEDGTIVVQSGRIIAVGATGAVNIPFDAKQLDLAGATVMPGLVDTHLHMRVPSNIFPEQSWMFLINLAYGVTTARDPSLSFDSFGYNEMLESGQMIGPRLYSVGRAVRLGDYVIRMNTLNEAQAIVDKRAMLGATTIKQYLLPTRLQREWLLIASRRAGLNMTNEGADAPITQIGMIKDGSSGVEHNPIWGDVYKDIIKFVASSGIYFTPTLQVCNGTEEGKEYFKYKYWHWPDQKLMRFTYSNRQGGLTANGAESIETIMNAHPQDTLSPGFLLPGEIDTRILRSGGRICLGSHGNDEGIGAHNEIWALRMSGFTNMEALQSATIRGAEALGIQRDIGSIEVGKIGDLLILSKNPLDDIHNTREIRYVIKDGILYEGNTLNMIWPMFKKCPEWKLH